MTRKALNPVTLATIIVIMYMTMPIVSVFISTYITTYAYMLLTVFIIGFIMLSGGVRQLNTMVYLLFPFAVYIACTFFIKTDSILLWGYQSMLFILPVLLGYFYLYYKDNANSMLAIAIIIAVIITVVTTIIGLIRFPYAARVLATIATSDDPEALKYDWNNIGGYTFTYTVVLLYPILILAYKLKRINRLVFLITVAVIMMMIILSEYAIALLLMIVSSVLFFATRRFNARHTFIFGIVLILSMFLLWGGIEKLLLWLAENLESETLSERLTALAGGITGVENSESQRIDLFRKSLEAFTKSPVFGQLLNGKTISGGHSFILDTLADYGVLGGAALVLAYRNIYRYFFKPFSKSTGFGYVLWAFVQTIILSTVNTGMWLTVLTFFIPLLLTLIYNSDNEDVEGIYEDSLDS